jgi:Macrocin-O-methyltransferase (TylF)
MIKALIRKALGHAGLAIINTRRHYDSDGLFTVHNDHFRRNPAFKAAYQRGLEANNGVDPHFEWRLHVALWVASSALGAPGDFVECGVNTGFISSAIMGGLNWGSVNKRFYLLDTFAGPVLSQFSTEEIHRGRRKSAEDGMASGAYETSVARVRANFAEWPNAVVVPGTVPDTLPALNIASVAFLHIDMNCAYPERAALEYFWNRLSPGAFVLLDDYAFYGHEYQAEAIDAVARSLGFDVLSLPTGQGLITKRKDGFK